MSFEEPALMQTRQLMVSQLPEYRPFALQEIVRAATVQGGGVRDTSLARAGSSSGSKNSLGVPVWLDIFVYCVAAFVVGIAIFMGMYTYLVCPHQRKQGGNDADDVSGSVYDPTVLIVRKAAPQVDGEAPARSLRTPPHPPPPMLPIAGMSN